SEAALRKKYKFSQRDWEALGSNERLIELVEDETTRRIRDGSSKRERAQQLVVKAPVVLGDIMNDPNANPRHGSGSDQVLDALAAPGEQTAAAEPRYVIHIDLGGGRVESSSKSRTIDATDEDPLHPTPPAVLAAITAKKKTEGGGGGNDYL